MFEAAGWPAKRELFDADLYVNLDGTELVVEVAMTNAQREVEHVQQHLETGFDAIWVVCPTKAVRDELRERLEENGLFEDCVTLHLFQDCCGNEQPTL